MSAREAEIHDLLVALSRLSVMVPTDSESLHEWYASAKLIEAMVARPGGLSAELPHFVWHFLADADIRLKDSRYADLQQRQLERLLSALKSGRIPDDEELSVEMDSGSPRMG